MVPYARHAVLGELRHLEVGKPGQLAEQDRIEIGVLGRLAAEGIQKRHRLVQVVHDRRMPLQVEIEQIAGAVPRVVDVPVVVVKNVLSPIRGAGHRIQVVGVVDLVAIVPIGIPVTAVGVGRRVDADNHVVADFADERGVLGHQAVRQLHQHLRRTRLRTVQTAHHHVHRLGLRDDLVCLGVAQAAGVGEPGHVLAIHVQSADVGLRRDQHDHRRPALFRLAGIDDLHPRGLVRQRPVILQEVFVVVELIRRADVVADDIARRGDRRGGRQVIHQRAHEFGLRRPFLHMRREGGIHCLAGVGLRDTQGRRHHRKGEHNNCKRTHGLNLPARNEWCRAERPTAVGTPARSHRPPAWRSRRPRKRSSERMRQASR